MWVLVAIMTVVGVPWPIVGSAAIMVAAPIPGVCVLVLIAVGQRLIGRRTSKSVDPETTLLRRLAAHVSAGLTLREAVAAAPHDVVSEHARRLCLAGSSMTEVGEALGSDLAVSGRRLAALCAMSELTGAPFGHALRKAADRSARMSDARRERRAALAQVRFSAWVVGMAPLALTAVVVASQGIPEPRGAIVIVPMVVGVCLQVVGTAVVFVLSGRAA